MIRPLALFVVLSALSGCWSGSTAGPTAVYDASRHAITRDLPAAWSYVGYNVRVRLEVDAYTVVGREVRVSGSVPGSPPLLVFVCRDVPPGGTGPLTLTGRVLPPVRDHIWRTARADFSLTVTDCTVTRP